VHLRENEESPAKTKTKTNKMMNSGGPGATQSRAVRNRAKRYASIGARITSSDVAAVIPTTTATTKATTNGSTRKTRPSRRARNAARNAWRKRVTSAAAALIANQTTPTGEATTSDDTDSDDEWYAKRYRETDHLLDDDSGIGTIKTVIIVVLVIALGVLAFVFVQNKREEFRNRQPSKIVAM
jgi:cobalamin biosynthesis Mg chelatase CobN